MIKTVDYLGDLSGVVVADFYATWCQPCRHLATILDRLASQFPSVTFVKLDIEQTPEETVRFQVRSVPTVIILKDGVLKEFMLNPTASKLITAIGGILDAQK